MEDINKLRETTDQSIKDMNDDFDQFRKDMSDGFDQFKKDIIKAIDRSSLLINATVVGMGLIQILFMYYFLK